MNLLTITITFSERKRTMLSLTKKIVVIALAGFVTALAASAQSKPKDEVLSASEQIKHQQAEESSQQNLQISNEQEKAGKEAQKGMEIAQKEMAKVKDKLGKMHFNVATTGHLFDQFGQKRPAVLVIPSSKIDADYISRATEDLTVMAKIIDKQLAQADMKKSYTFDLCGNETQCICIEGFGALFETKVDFPLIPPPEKPQESNEAPQKDQLWEQTKREIDAPSQYGPVPGAPVVPSPSPFGQPRVKKYDPAKVDNLKNVLITTLKYAANIRDTRPDESITIVVGTETPSVPFSGQTLTVSTKDGNTFVNGQLPVQKDFSSKGVLVVRAKKSDVDAYYAGKIDEEEFTKRVSILVY
jgi:hypothetical protein